MEKQLRGLAALALLPIISTACTSIGFLVNFTHFTLFGVLGALFSFVLVGRLGGWKSLLLSLFYAIFTFFIADIFLFGQLGDYFHYHYPQALLLEQGWNPVFQPSMESVAEAFNLELDTFRPVHTICFPLLLAQWTAIVDTITGSLCGYIWVVFLFLPAVAWMIWTTLKRFSGLAENKWGYTLLLLGFIACGYRSYFNWTPVDSTIFLTTLFFLLSFIHVLEKAYGWTTLCFGVAAVMLCGMKQSCVLFVAIPLITLLGIRLVKRDWHALERDMLLTLGIALGVILLCFHPYMTNWSLYGSPLFPAHSFVTEWQNWDVTIDLGRGGALDRPSLIRFLMTQVLWISLTLITAILAWKHQNARKWLLLELFLLLSVFLLPSKLYTYSRYLTPLPLILLFTLLAVIHCRTQKYGRYMWKGMCGVTLCWLLLTTAYVGIEMLSLGILALDTQSIFYTPAKEGELILVSTRAFLPKANTTNVYLTAPNVYPLRPNTYFIETFLEHRLHQPITRHYEWTKEDLSAHAKPITDLWLVVSKEAPTLQILTPRPIRLIDACSFPLKLLRTIKLKCRYKSAL